jgi:hypothetical protein
MRRVLRRLALVTAAVLPLPVAVGVMATGAYAGRIVNPATGCYEIVRQDVPPIPPLPQSDGCQVTFVLDAAARSDVPVAVRTVEGTAHAGADFVAVDQVLVIPAGALELDVRLAIVPDDREEPAEQFTVVFEVLAADLAERVEAVVTILDGDGGPERSR